MPSGRLDLEPPPELPGQDSSGGMLMQLMPMLGSLGSIVMVIFMGRTNPMSYVTGAMFLFSSLGFVGVNGWRQRSQRVNQTMAARREYLAYLADSRKTIRQAAQQQHDSMFWESPPPSALVHVAEERSRVWERGPADDDFLVVRAGLADQPLALDVVEPDVSTLARLDPVAASAAHRFVVTHRQQRDLPLCINLRGYYRVEAVGAEAPARALARALVLQAATWHSPDDLQIAVLASEDVIKEWEWVKWLPHAQSTRVNDGVGPARMIAPVFAELEDMLPEGLKDRPRFGPSQVGDTAPHLLLVTDGVELPPGHALAGDEGVMAVTILDLPTRWDTLASPNVLRFTVGQAPGAAQAGAKKPRWLMSMTNLSGQDQAVVPDGVSIVEAEAAARRLAPLNSAAAKDAAGAGSDHVASAEITDLLGLPDIRDIDIRKAWKPRLARDRLRVPIGLSPEGRRVYLDIKESAQQGMGPHGLIIGATGSGKSEVLRTLVLALALTHSSEQLNFVLIDFKGGATFAPMEGMPHVSAIITNLENELSLVDRMQDALHGEMVRRQELLRSAGNFVNVTEYEKARLTDRPDLEPLPDLLIVADEFSELLSAKPEFVDTFVEIGRLGRSLHVHLLLSSQRLEEGKLRGLDSHLSYRIGLRTFSAAESRTVLGVPDAYELPPIPGSGYLKPDTTTMIRFRAAYVSGPPPARRRTHTADAGAGPGRVRVEPFTAAPVAAREAEAAAEPEVEVKPVEPEEPASRLSTFELAVQKMMHQGPPAHPVWLPPLEIPDPIGSLMPDLEVDEELGLVSKSWRAAGGMTIPMGIVDRPLEQRRENLVVNLDGAAGHMAIAGGPRTGKSTAVRTLVTGLALTHTPLEVQIYVLDFGGGTFTGLKDMAHVSGVAMRTEAEAVRRTIAEVNGILNGRETFFRDNSIDSIETYRRRRAQGQTDDGYGDIFLVIDGWGSFKTEFEELEPTVSDIASRGLTYGIHIVLTAARWLEIRAAIKDMIGTRLELRLGDPTDSELDRKAAGNVPKGMPGRGITPSKHHMLTALPRIDGSQSVEDLSDGVENLVKRVNEAWTGKRGPKLQLLPTNFSLDDLRAQADPEDHRILLGLEEKSMRPFGIDPLTEPHVYCYGDSGSGKSSLLRAVALEVARLYTPAEAKIIAVDYRRSLLGDIPESHLLSYLTTHDAAMEAFGDLLTLFKSRLPGPDVTAEQLRERSWWKGSEAYILVDDYDLVATSAGNPIAEIAPVMAQAADVGLHIVLTRRSGGASRAAYDPVIQRMTDLSATALLLSGNPEEGQLVGRVRPMFSVPGRVQVVSRDRGHEIAQLAYPPRAIDQP
jgi:S-DNA-T family DNA segregation ATPase FtsK/SpoIIIE